MQYLCSFRRIPLAGQVQSDEETVTQQEQADAQGRENTADQKFETEGVPDTLVIFGAVELSGENACTGTGTEDTKVKYKDQTVDDGDTTHGQCAHLAHHDVVQHGNKIGDAVLYDNGDGNPKNPAVKCFVADITIMHDKPHMEKCRAGS